MCFYRHPDSPLKLISSIPAIVCKELDGKIAAAHFQGRYPADRSAGERQFGKSSLLP